LGKVESDPKKTKEKTHKNEWLVTNRPEEGGPNWG